MIINKKTTLAEFITISDVFKIDEVTIDNLFEQLKSYPIVDIFRISFNELKFKQLIDLQTKIKTVNDMIFVPLEVVHGLKKEDVLQLSAFDCFRFALYSKDELERITNLFKPQARSGQRENKQQIQRDSVVSNKLEEARKRKGIVLSAIYLSMWSLNLYAEVICSGSSSTPE